MPFKESALLKAAEYKNFIFIIITFLNFYMGNWCSNIFEILEAQS